MQPIARPFCVRDTSTCVPSSFGHAPIWLAMATFFLELWVCPFMLGTPPVLVPTGYFRNRNCPVRGLDLDYPHLADYC